MAQSTCLELNHGLTHDYLSITSLVLVNLVCCQYIPEGYPKSRKQTPWKPPDMPECYWIFFLQSGLSGKNFYTPILYISMKESLMCDLKSLHNINNQYNWKWMHFKLLLTWHVLVNTMHLNPFGLNYHPSLYQGEMAKNGQLKQMRFFIVYTYFACNFWLNGTGWCPFAEVIWRAILHCSATAQYCV